VAAVPSGPNWTPPTIIPITKYFDSCRLGISGNSGVLREYDSM
jgi:hypothetical protein